MRRHLTAWILCLIMIASTALPAAAEEGAFEIQENGAAASGFVGGHIEEEIELRYPPDSAAGLLRAESEYPSVYPEDGNYEKYVTSVKDQGENGLCWDFAATAAVESWLKKNKGETVDLSEAHMAYAMSKAGENRYGSDYRPTAADGGNRTISSAYFMRGMPDGDCAGGSVSEADDPYTTEELVEREASVTLSGKPKVVMPQNVIFISDEKTERYDESLNNRIKDAVMEYGSVGAAINWQDRAYDGTNASYYRSNKSGDLNHDVLIVGWDDNYPAGNFREKPDGDGAWIIKNSWGTDHGKDGYNWVSYYDGQFPGDVYAIDGVVSYDSSNEYIYEYDYQSVDGYYCYDAEMYLRYYTAKEDAVITDAEVFIESDNAGVEADIISDMDADGFDLDKYAFSAKGSLNTVYPGWYTIPLDDPVVVRKGKRFAAVIRTQRSTWIGEDIDDRSISKYGGYYDGKWYTDADHPDDNYGFRIKAKSTNDKELVHRYGGHMYGAWTVTKEASCTEEGSRYRTCSYCNYIDTEAIPKTAHPYGAWYTTAEATETAGGQETRKCSVCGAAETRATATLAPTLPAVKISKPKAGAKSVEVRWKKVSAKKRKRIKKIEIQYSADRSFRTGVKTKRVSSKKASVKIKGLKSKTKYYVRLRGYAKSGGEHVSAWSAVKTCRTK